MKFEIVVNELDEEMKNKLSLIKDFSLFINNFSSNNFYSDDLKSIRLIIILIKTQKGYEEWFKVRKPKFITHKIIETFTGDKIEINKEFVIETRIDNEDYDNFLQATDEESKRVLALEILKSLSYLDALPKKVKDFDKERFKLDIEQFFKTEKLI